MRGTAERELIRAATGVSAVDASDEDVARSVSQEGFEGLLYARAATAKDRPGRWRRQYLLGAADNLRKLHVLHGALTQLPDDLEPVVMPGASLLPLYPDPGCRPMDDIDLLAPPGQHAALRRGLRSAGMRSTDRHPDLLQHGHLTVDVHTDLINGERIRSRRTTGLAGAGAGLAPTATHHAV